MQIRIQPSQTFSYRDEQMVFKVKVAVGNIQRIQTSKVESDYH